ncbi:DNA/RNA non-specific endonuclease [Chromobacterium amazonense]|uniref:DNA/RNA non-specific endonuclease n=1 Tax=Chromobacterium amazonense TaxID=1382803 RepID=UPI003F7A5C61
MADFIRYFHSEKCLKLMSCIIFAGSISSSYADNLQGIAIDNCAVGCPIDKASNNQNVRIVRSTYTLSNNKTTKFADWVAYKITRDSILGGQSRNWKADPELSPTDSLSPSDYTGANASLKVDRGHQAPLSGLAGRTDSETLNYLSNITPQKAELNQGPWEKLESQEKNLLSDPSVNEVYVVTGPLYERYVGTLPGTNKQHTIPSGYFKVIFINGNPITNGYGAFIMDQEVSRNANFCNFQTSLYEIEQRSGIVFWSNLVKSHKDSVKNSRGSLSKKMGCV